MRSRRDDGADRARRTLLALAAMAPALTIGTASNAEPKPMGTVELPHDLANAIKQFEQATFANDIVVLGNLVTEDYLLVNSDSTVQGKRSYLADFTAPGFKLDPYVIEEPVLKIWGTTALTAGRSTLAWTQGGRRQSRQVRIAHLWIKEHGHWQLAYTQLTRVIAL